MGGAGNLPLHHLHFLTDVEAAAATGRAKKENYAEKAPAGKAPFLHTTRGKVILLIVGILIIGAIVGGAVGGTVGKGNKTSSAIATDIIPGLPISSLGTNTSTSTSTTRGPVVGGGPSTTEASAAIETTSEIGGVTQGVGAATTTLSIGGVAATTRPAGIIT